MKIESGIPVPPKRTSKYPFATMKVGQSIVTRGTSARVLASIYAKKHGVKFRTETVDTDLVRIWRVE